MDKQVWNSCRSPNAFTGYESRAEGFLIAHKLYRSRFDDFLHCNSTAPFAAGDPINQAPNSYLLVRCQLYHSTLGDPHDLPAVDAGRRRHSRLDHIAICLIKKHVVPNGTTGLPNHLTVASRSELSAYQKSNDSPL